MAAAPTWCSELDIDVETKPIYVFFVELVNVSKKRKFKKKDKKAAPTLALMAPTEEAEEEMAPGSTDIVFCNNKKIISSCFLYFFPCICFLLAYLDLIGGDVLSLRWFLLACGRACVRSLCAWLDFPLQSTCHVVMRAMFIMSNEVSVFQNPLRPKQHLLPPPFLVPVPRKPPFRLSRLGLVGTTKTTTTTWPLPPPPPPSPFMSGLGKFLLALPLPPCR